MKKYWWNLRLLIYCLCLDICIHFVLGYVHVFTCYTNLYTHDCLMGMGYFPIYTMRYWLLLLHTWLANIISICVQLHMDSSSIICYTPLPIANNIIIIILCLLPGAPSMVLWHQSMGVACIIFEPVEILTDGNMALHIKSNNILFYHLEAFMKYIWMHSNIHILYIIIKCI